MVSLSEAAKTLGLSERQLRRRIAILRPALNEQVAHGQNGRLMLSEKALALVGRLEDLRRTGGLTVEQAAKVIMAGAKPGEAKCGQSGGEFAGDLVAQTQVDALEKELRQLQRTMLWTTIVLGILMAAIAAKVWWP